MTKKPKKTGMPPSAMKPVWFDYVLAAGALAILAALLVALFRGQSEWHLLPPVVWFHIVTIGLALVLTPTILLRRKGNKLHRWLGYIWVALMVSTALATFNITMINDGSFSPIHLLSVLTLYVCGKLVWNARKHKVHSHLNNVRGIIVGALLIAGFFTFPFNRLLGRWMAGLDALSL